MRADLHIHSRYSDGGLWPGEIARRAAAAGLEAACLTDHDTLGGWPDFSAAARGLGLRTWPAVEIDCVDGPSRYRSEILAYFPEGGYARTEALLAPARAERAERVATLFGRAAGLFGAKATTFEALEARRSEGRPGGPPDPASLRYSKTDLFLALRDGGALAPSVSYRDFKKAYFEGGPFAGARFRKPSLEAVSEAVRADGGVLVVPHPGHEFGDSVKAAKAGGRRLERLLRRLRELGVQGLELYEYRNADSDDLNALMRDWADRLGFFCTYGSDSHGPGSGKDGLGSFYGDFGGFDSRGGHGGRPGRKG